ncbi:hypothetical protein CR203_17720 [Salipaludibacillus neizhouensis]|uniref:Fimbrial assembly protein n=1 Tax=Salipaludibacillus neizhouensis TaxID=885475 RepID=A0A3A9K610_9BACI|nr:hypothetical protein [Salipaludibacillus neizhouensis]RKL65912.1 hypothetical protein CR203_17720 [Salipaludibacillus neizhouensis]
MNVEINLLPKKARGNRIQLLLLFLLIITMMMVVVFAFLFHQNQEQRSQQLEREIENVREMQQVITARQANMGSDGSKLESAVEELEGQRKPISRLLETFVRQLPERGFIETFEYQEEGIITADIQFDEQREAASFLHAVDELVVVEEAMIDEMLAEEIIFNEDEWNEEVLPRYIASFTITLDTKMLLSPDLWEEQLEDELEEVLDEGMEGENE